MTSTADIPPIPPGTLRLVSSPPDWPFSNRTSSQRCLRSDNINISILDSSFNPPTLAHLALASTPFPDPTRMSPNTPRLLLFSTTNADKTSNPSDPTLAQRIQMISLLASKIGGAEPTAVGLINEPTFVGKSNVICSYLNDRTGGRYGTLTFIIGTDTLTRFFDPRYYASIPGGIDVALSRFFVEQGSILVSTRRGGENDRKVEDALMARDEVKRWIDQGKVWLTGTGEEDWVFVSSTNIRQAVKVGDWDSVHTMTTPEIIEYIRQEGLYK